jgi:MYXO-CTERM domain-containing protein
MGNFPTTVRGLYPQGTHRVLMRGFASVLTVAFVFASASLLLGQAAGQSSTEPMPPEEYRQPPPDAFLEGTVTGPGGSPVAGAYVSSSNYGSPEPRPAEDPASGNGSSGSASPSMSYCCCCYGGGYNQTVTDSSGHFRLGVYAGENQVSVSHPDFVARNDRVAVEKGQTVSHDVSLEAYPEKTAHIVGKVTDAKSGKALPFASLSLRSPLYGLYACSQPEGASSGSAGGAEPGTAASDEKSMIAPAYEGCAITVHSDGTYDGYVTPGYSILSVYAWQDCSTSRDADGGGSTTCGPEYLSWTRTLNLPANETTRIDVALPSRPSPDATVSGYLIDAETGKAVAGGQISFSNQETYAYGYATTDSDGSFKIRLRSGYHSVSVYSMGYLSWEGVLQVKVGSNDYDVKLTPGQESYGGGCCYAYDSMEKAVASETAVGAPAPMANAGSGDGVAADEDDQPQSVQYEDLGGGLGPYDASKRTGIASDPGVEDADKGAPGAGLLLALAALGAVLVLRRRKA